MSLEDVLKDVAAAFPSLSLEEWRRVAHVPASEPLRNFVRPAASLRAGGDIYELLAASFPGLSAEDWRAAANNEHDRQLVRSSLLRTPAERAQRCPSQDYDALLPDTVPVDFEGHEIRVLSLIRLIKAKAAAGRAKDEGAMPILLAALAEIESRKA